jgi:hypothetical protein
MEYALENNSSLTKFKIAFRVASPNTDGKLDYYLDNVLVKQLSIPNTGGWQTWQSVNDLITINAGKHYLKVVASKGGYNMNYIDIASATGLDEVSDNSLTVYPNPVVDRMSIRSSNFNYDKVEILNSLGVVVYADRPANFEQESQISVNLPNGIYFVRISKGNQNRITKMVVNK